MSTSTEIYRSRMGMVLTYIDEHLHEELNIAILANVANFSPFHFQRIFKSLCGESPYDMILRKRLEKSVFLLKRGDNLSIKEIAHTCGFASIENYSRQFKARYKITPSTFKKDRSFQNSRIYQEPNSVDPYLDIEQSRKESGPGFHVNIGQEKEKTVAVIRAIFGKDASALVQSYQRLVAWYQTKYPNRPMHRYGMSMDDPAVTPAGKYRYDFAIEVDDDFETEGEFIREIIPGGKYASIHCMGNINVVAQAWDYLYKIWLPSSDYLPAHFPAIEAYNRGPEDIGWEKFDLNCKILLTNN